MTKGIGLCTPYLLLRFGFTDIRLELAGDRGNFFKETEFAIIKVPSGSREGRNDHLCHSIEHRLHRVGLRKECKVSTGNTTCPSRIAHLFSTIIFVGVRFHIPDDLVAEQLRNFGSLKNEPLDITYHGGLVPLINIT